MDRLFHKGTRLLADTDPRFQALVLGAGLECMLVAFGSFSDYFVHHFTMIPWVWFLACAWRSPLSPTAKKQILAGAAMALWFSVVQYYQQITEGVSWLPGPFFTVYLLAFPFAAGADDGKRKLGLKLSGALFLGASLILAFFIGLLALKLLPSLLQPYIYWDGARLRALRHPNVTGNCFLIAVGFCLFFFASTPKRRYKAIFLALAVLFFLPIIWTNSRTAILTTCALCAGTVFFLIWKGGVKRFFLGAVAAAAALVLLFSLTQAVFSFHENFLIRSYLQEQATTGITNPDLIVDQQTGEANLHTDSSQNSLVQDLGTLNSRTSIWRASLRAVQADPMILVRGCSDIRTAISNQHAWSLTHTHNSWLEILLGLGLPGFLLSLAFTALALWHIFRIFFLGSHSLSRKIIALLALCLLVSGIPENVLFFPTKYYHYANFVFFLCLGYLTQWKEAE